MRHFRQLGVGALLAACLACSGGSTSDPLYPAVFYDCSVNGSIAFSASGGGSQAFSPDYCSYEVLSNGDVAIAFSTFNSAGWQFANPVDIWLHVDSPDSPGTLRTVAVPSTGALASGQVAIEFWDNTNPRTRYAATLGQSVNLTNQLPGPAAPVQSSTKLAVTGVELSSGATLGFDVTLSLSSTQNFCHPYAAAISEVVNQNQCAGAPLDAAKEEQTCNDGERTYVEPANCSVAYAAYLQCAIAANECSPCVTEYCAFNSCMCNYWEPTSDGCLATCP